MSIKKPSDINKGSKNLFRGAILLVLSSALVTLQSTCDSGGSRTESLPEWELDEEEEDDGLNDEDTEKKPDSDSKEKNIEADPIDDPFYTRHA